MIHHAPSPVSDHRLLEVHQLLVSMASQRQCSFTNVDMVDAANLILELYQRRADERDALLKHKPDGAGVADLLMPKL
jgi:hypothetical protein